MPIPVAQLVEQAADLFNVPTKDILSPSRLQEHVRPRGAIALAALLSGRGQVDIARRLQRKCHSSIHSLIKSTRQRIEANADYRAKVEALIATATDWNSKYAIQ